MKQSSSQERSKQNNLERCFEKLRKDNYENTFHKTEGWLRSINVNSSKTKSEGIFINMKNYFAVNKFKFAYSFLILAFVVAACNYPVVQNEAVGDVISWSADKNNTEAASKIASLGWLKQGQYSFNETTDNGISRINYSFVTTKENHDKINDFRKQLESIPGISNIKVIALNETVERPVYAAIMNGVFKIDINAANKSDEEVADEISAQLKNAGVENVQVTFEKNSDGIRMMKLFVPEQDVKKDGGFDITVKDGNQINRMKQVRKTGNGDVDRFKNKTDEEIKKMVKEELNDPDLSDDKIEIVREGDRVMVRVKTDSKNGNKLEIEDEIK